MLRKAHLAKIRNLGRERGVELGELTKSLAENLNWRSPERDEIAVEISEAFVRRHVGDGSGRLARPRETFGVTPQDRLARALDALFEIGIANCARLNKVDPTTEERLEQLFEPKIGLERPGRSALELDEEIEIAARRIEIIARRRAEKVEAAHVEAAAQMPQFLSTR